MSKMRPFSKKNQNVDLKRIKKTQPRKPKRIKNIKNQIKKGIKKFINEKNKIKPKLIFINKKTQKNIFK
jgi:hypothetical protein